ncbi:MAG: Hsp20/alpha crystallin family protein [Candidatus Methanoperedenaceae archaeon]|nr:Hsp20/alpha crystallin family protein [Candidatus Methanoperedenaceae archaeon]
MFRRRYEKELFEEMEQMMEEMNRAMSHMTHSRDPKVFGYSMYVGPDGVPHVEHFGNTEPVHGACGTCEFPGSAEETGVREPYTSSVVDEKKNEVYITAEMPGVEKQDIKVNATENTVLIKAVRGERNYAKTVTTPCEVEPDSATAKYNNGVLEVTLKLKTFLKPEGKSVNIE